MGKVLILGCGLVGKTIIKDLAKNHLVGVVDVNKSNLDEITKFVECETYLGNASDKSFLETLVDKYELIVSAVPGFLGFNVLKTLIEFRKNVVDIAFFPESPFDLHDYALKNDVSCVVDCGVAPGLSHAVLGYYSTIEPIDEALIYVGGLPFERKLPFEYKAPFSPVDVLEEYIRPARYLQEGRIVEKEPLTEIELIDFKGIGTLEAFLTDGLRTLLTTVDIPNMKEKTLRFPGYAEKINFLKACGFLDNNPIDTRGGKAVPMDLTEKLLFSLWKLEPEDEEFTVMRIVLTSKENKRKIVYELFDRTDKENKDYSMGRTTGFVACATANLMLQNRIDEKGIIPPEVLGRNEYCFNFILNYLKERKVQIQVVEE